MGWWWVAKACNSLNQGFSSGPEIEVRPLQWDHWILATRPVTSDKALPIDFVEMNFHKEMESSENNQVFIRRKNLHVNRLSWVASESRTLMVVWITYMGLPLASHLALWAPSPYLIYPKVLMACTRISQPKRILVKRPMIGWHCLLRGGTPFLSDPQGDFLSTWSWGGLLDLKNDKYVVHSSLIWAEFNSTSLLLLSSSWSIYAQGTNPSYSAWGPPVSSFKAFGRWWVMRVERSWTGLVPLL